MATARAAVVPPRAPWNVARFGSASPRDSRRAVDVTWDATRATSAYAVEHLGERRVIAVTTLEHLYLRQSRQLGTAQPTVRVECCHALPFLSKRVACGASPP
jgi:hypothetical protein